MSKMTRRQVLGIAAAGVAMLGFGLMPYTFTGRLNQAAAFNSSRAEMVVYRSPTCGCCAGWADHMEEAGFQTTHQVVDDMATIKEQHNIPQELLSCHTTLVDGYIVEGHVPTEAVQRLLSERPNIAGIAVPGMPLGTPGMEANGIQEPYTVYAFDEQGQISTFAEYDF